MPKAKKPRSPLGTASRTDPERSNSTPATWWAPGLLATVGVLTYWNSLTGAFQLDDRVSIVDNSSIRTWWNLGAVLFPEGNSSVAGRPLVNLSFALNYAVGGTDVRGYHAVNIAIHVACALLAFGIVRATLDSATLRGRLGATPSALALSVALIWAVHPLNSEVVDYLTQRTESMMALFFLLTLYASVKALHHGRRIWPGVAVAACAAGMACKESMVVAPIAVVLYDWFFAFDSLRAAIAARRRLYLGLAATWLLLAALMWSGPRSDAAGFSTGIDPWTYLLNQAVMIARYLGLSIWPRQLVALYGWPVPLRLWDVWPQALVVGGLLAATVLGLRRRSKLAFLGAWFFVTLAPTSSLVPIATEVGAERRMYLPLLAVTTLGVLGASALGARVAPKRDKERGGRPAPWDVGWAAVVAGVVIALSAQTMARNREYESALSLARTIVDRHPTGLGHQVLGEQLMAAGDHDGAIGQLREAVKTNSRARFSLGAELFTQGRIDEALSELQAFVKTSDLPYRLVPHWQEPSAAELLSAHEMMGRAHALQQRWPEAIQEFRLAAAMAPENQDLLRLLADALFSGQQLDEAIPRYEAYLETRPADAEALGNLGVALASTGRTLEAIGVFRRAVAVHPQDAVAHRNLAAALRDSGDLAEARREMERSLQLDGAGPDAATAPER